MVKVKFVGTSDSDFTNNKNYVLISMEHNSFSGMHWALLSNNKGKLSRIPYSLIAAFNENWTVLDK